MSMRRVAVDFRPARGKETTSLVCTTLMHHSRKGRNAENASTLAVESFRRYDGSEPESITAIYDFRNRSQTFVEEFGIKRREDIYNAIKNIPVDFDTELVEPMEKQLIFSEEDAAAMDMIEKLNQVRYRDRGILLSKIVYQYLAHGNNEFYNKLSAYRLLEYLKDEYVHAGDLGSEKLEFIINQICANGIKPEERQISDDEFRRLIGVKTNNISLEGMEYGTKKIIV